MSDLPMPPPRFPESKFSTARVEREDGVGCLLVSRTSGRRFFCPDGSPSLQTQFGAVCKIFEAWGTDITQEEEDSLPDEHEDRNVEGSSIVIFDGRVFRYYPARPMALKTSHIDMLKLEANYQQRELGELTGEDPLKEVAALQLLQSHPNVEELEEAMTDGTNLYKVTPWYEGGELFDLAPMPEQSAKTVFAQLLDGLEFLHSSGVCHRDISLENILMDIRMPDRSSASCRSSSVSSVGSCISVASSAFSCDDHSISNSSRTNDNDNGSPRSCFGDATVVPNRGGESDEFTPSRREDHGGNSSGASQEQQAGEKAQANEGSSWIGRPRLCDFGMSVRIPRSKSGKRVPITPQGRCGKNTCVAPEVFNDEVFDAEAIDTWSLGTTLFMALLGVQPWEEVGDYKFQAIAEGKNLEVVLEGWKIRHLLSQEAVDLLQLLLTADPVERLSDPKIILLHPWFTN